MVDVCLVTPPTTSHRTAEENLGLGYLAAALRSAGYSVEILDAWLGGLGTTDLVDRVVRLAPRLLIGFSSYRSNMASAVEVLQGLRSRGIATPVVAGGYGPTFHSTDFLEAGFDFVLAGEAEEAIVRLTNVVEQAHGNFGDVPGLRYVGPGGQPRENPTKPVQELDDLEWPSRDTLDLVRARQSAVHLSTSRGCLAHCLFCSIIAFQREAGAPRWRQRSVNSVVAELRALYDLGVQHVKIVDDSFVEPPRDAAWCEQFADAVEAAGIGGMTLRGSIRADRVNDRVAAALRRAGFVAFSCGVENFSDSALRRMNKTATRSENIAALDSFSRAGILVQMGMILFDPGTTMSELRENAESLKLFDHVVTKGVFTEMYAAAGTAFTKAITRRGLATTSESLTVMNSAYQVLDPEVRLVYRGLKAWHRSQSALYDMAIDPVSAPKALAADELRSFMPVIRALTARDVAVLDVMIDLVEAGAGLAEVDHAVSELIGDRAAEATQLQTATHELYSRFGLTYDAAPNPFLDA